MEARSEMPYPDIADMPARDRHAVHAPRAVLTPSCLILQSVNPTSRKNSYLEEPPVSLKHVSLKHHIFSPS